ncbi:hypothetical protein [Rhizobium sp. Leaf383]|uniref:hypothetical protein n=1 Tax=Rhizobium sp. Leaf383 TaxID=1736357 RepID=UPI0007135515|nr:hypothetical protein [Rhizobium sp. Leaf383]KQS84256.1 hypothetical protein ASG58_21030 [Rhizobium sp. Leaf383]
MIYENLHSSLTMFAMGIIEDRKIVHTGETIEFIDWEAHANIFELPDHDLVGLTTLALTEDEPETFNGSFTIGISTFASDKNLFRLRNYVGEAYRRMRPGSKIPFYDAEACKQTGWILVADGTTVMPMTRADARPLQFVQCSFVIDPITAVG